MSESDALGLSFGYEICIHVREFAVRLCMPLTLS